MYNYIKYQTLSLFDLGKHSTKRLYSDKNKLILPIESGFDIKPTADNFIPYLGCVNFAICQIHKNVCKIPYI